ncbi:response regulator transcription factor [Oleisolibacter albus]|uniref:response regulator transcription factor n=1 Tax=Oleisolibacter albus TaxID=2171757 RepID=UPI000DF2A615|nr:response regulator transcription factor [Oleisolibacter albus]
MRVLLIENDRTIAGAISRAVARVGVRCELQSQPEIESLIADKDGNLENYDAILVGGVSTADVFVARLRATVGQTIIVSLLDHRCVASTVQHLRAGADDVLVKPINPQEIEARLHAVRRRTHGHSSPELSVGRLTVYLDGRDPSVDGRRLRLSHREHAIFSVLALNVGRVVSKEKIYESVYTLSGSDPLDKVIDVYICKLRKKIAEATGGDKYIETVYGRGYKFEAPTEDERDVTPAAFLQPSFHMPALAGAVA